MGPWVIATAFPVPFPPACTLGLGLRRVVILAQQLQVVVIIRPALCSRNAMINPARTWRNRLSARLASILRVLTESTCTNASPRCSR
ncbi:hypothetical protein SEA_CHERRYONLIM_72 [Gordonia phage CherryonLim]|uniref:Uncharacterized protein n=2 Tax=Ponsvirus TaxID=3044795 RepID=A0A5P8DA00_9CAUD|nr:hypothetical protein PP994_gp72 [Gordonia phage CherryonLim]YP_010663348.1 hypothetical protein PP996_gp75 [Gordonia phage SheckWes]QDM56501.1 hypothetical protein SEA_SHECKWES_75 [Gordonia phage SheckWes]QFP95825.1 hypothetical protein SEA_CHERRYONLIM_72 [Gordonia phage CherryonLim]